MHTESKLGLFAGVAGVVVAAVLAAQNQPTPAVVQSNPASAKPAPPAVATVPKAAHAPKAAKSTIASTPIIPASARSEVQGITTSRSSDDEE